MVTYLLRLIQESLKRNETWQFASCIDIQVTEYMFYPGGLCFSIRKPFAPCNVLLWPRIAGAT